MPDPRTGILRTVTTAATLLAASLTLVVPAVAAQTTEDEPAPPRWTQSSFDEPFDEFVTEVRDRVVEVSGTFRFQKPEPDDSIVEATFRLVDDPEDDFTPLDACDYPDAVEVRGDGPSPTETYDELPFTVELDIECNGRYLLEATARADAGGNSTFTMRRSLLVLVLPPPVPQVEVELQQESGRTSISWGPVPDADFGPDALGYLVERAGPADDQGFGVYEDLRTVGRFDDLFVADRLPEPGTYSYRVRAVRRGPDGAVASSILQTQTHEVTLQPPPTTTTPEGEDGTTTTTRAAPRVGGALPTAPRRTPPSFGTPTTADTGFEETLDYGDRSLLDEFLEDAEARQNPGELASEDLGGQSIVRDEGEGVNMLIPAAGALVLLGWAGHLIYLNRLAKEL